MSPEADQMLSHYRLVEKIGEGGMGMVWKAEDTVLGRKVAIKLLQPEATRDEERRVSFLREARLAASIGDNHVVQVHELGREGETDFIVMEYVEGHSLEKLLHGRPLPPEKVVGFGVQVARALARAHRRGLVHRDIKPANILVTPEGDVKVVDFGLATLFATPPRRPVGSEDETKSRIDRTPASDGATAGTLPYMAPEQARGEGTSPRSDVFSFGVVLYEMTTGRRPFRGATAVDLLAEILKGKPDPVHDLVPDVPLELDRIVQKALSPRPADRYQTMDDLAVDLRRLARELESGSSPRYEDLRSLVAARRPRRKVVVTAAAAAIVLVLLGAWWFLIGPRPVASSPGLLILPLEVYGQEEGADYVGRAFAEALAVQLAEAKGLGVLPVPEAQEFETAGALDRARRASEIGAAYVLTGRLERRGKAVEANLSLIDASENRVVWGGRRDSAEGDLPALASALARDVAEKLGAVFPHMYGYPWNLADSPALAASTAAAEVIGAFARGDYDAALEPSARLVAELPHDPGALTLRALAVYRRWWSTQTPEDGAELDDALAELEQVAPDTPHISNIRSQRLVRAGRPKEAIKLLEQVLQRRDIGPRLRAWTSDNHAATNRLLGNYGEAIQELDDAIHGDPSNVAFYVSYSLALRATGRVDEAVAPATQAVALAPLNWICQSTLYLALSRAGRHDEAVKPAKRSCELARNQNACADYATVLREAGRKEEALVAVSEAEALPDSIWGTYNLACFWAIGKDSERALRWLRRSVDLGMASAYLAEDPDFAPLHGDPEFEAMVAEVEKRIGK